jgi:hypothetical protein
LPAAIGANILRLFIWVVAQIAINDPWTELAAPKLVPLGTAMLAVIIDEVDR